MIEQFWVRALFQEFCAWDGLSRTAGNMTRRIDAYATCFATLDRHCPGPAAFGQDLLLRLFGAEGLRCQHLVVRFLVERLVLDWDPGRTEAAIEAGRTGAILAASDERPWGPVLRSYRDQLARDPALPPRTVRLYLNAAAGLLAHAGHADQALLRQTEVNRYLRRKPGQRASLARFLTHVARAAGVQLAVPRRRRCAAPKTRDEVLLRGVREALDRLDRATSAAEGRAVLASAISKVYAVPLSTVLAVRATDVAAEGTTVTLWPDGLALDVAPVLAKALWRWASWDGGYLFPGRNRIQPLSRDAAHHHVCRRVSGCT